MNRAELVDALAQRRSIPRGVAADVVDLILSEMRETLLQGGRIEFRGFGSFKIKTYDSYVGRNPRTSQAVMVPPKRLPVFRISSLLHQRLNADLDG